jgi:hypothetical protein
MFTCDPTLLVLFVVLVILIALILREMAVRGGILEGAKLFDGAYSGRDGGAVLMSGGNCCGGSELNISHALC